MVSAGPARGGRAPSLTPGSSGLGEGLSQLWGTILESVWTHTFQPLPEKMDKEETSPSPPKILSLPE